MTRLLAGLGAFAGLMATSVVGLVGATSSAQAWQASGQNGRVAWASNMSGNFDIWTMNADGSDKKDVTNSASPVDEFQPEWSPDGSQIVYTRDPDGGGVARSEIWMMQADGSSPHAVATVAGSQVGDGNLYKPTWSPDGTRILFADHFDDGTENMWLVPAAASGPHTATLADSQRGWPAWSPAGAVATRRSGSVADQMTCLTPDLSQLQGSTTYATHPAKLYHPAFSPDGATWTYEISTDGTAAATDIWIAPACSDGSAAVRITSDAIWQGFPSWSPDGKRLIFSEASGAHSHLVSQSIANPSDRATLTDDSADNNDPSWTAGLPTSPPPGPMPSAPTCAGLKATIVGTGAEPIVGTAGDDVISGTGGNDTIVAGGGADVVCGGAGNDVIKGNGGNDKLFGEGGNDKLKGGGGKDVCTGGPGRDTAKKCEKVRSVP